MTCPPPEVLRNVVVGPLLPGSSKYQMVFNTSPGGLPLPHLRIDPQGGARSICQIGEMPPEDAARAERIPGKVIYAGPMQGHFGHFLAEGIHRIYARKLFPELADAKLAFQMTGWKKLVIPAWADRIFALLGVTRDDMVLIERPMHFEELHVPVQGRLLGGKLMFEGYTGLFPLQPLPASHPGATPRHLYVSRSRHLYSGSYFGETLVEKILAEQGVHTVFPESMPIDELLPLLQGAETIVFCEGSAIHNLELLGRIGARVFIIGRRSGTRERFAEIMDSLVSAWDVSDADEPGIPLDWDRSRQRPSGQRAGSYIDIPALVARLSGFLGLALRQPGRDETAAAISQDVASYVLDPRTTRKETTDERLGHLLRLLREHHAAMIARL